MGRILALGLLALGAALALLLLLLFTVNFARGGRAAAGFQTLAIEAGSIGKSAPTGWREPVNQHDLAADAHAVLQSLGLLRERGVAVVGHAFGNRTARTFAADYPALVAKTVLLAAGGRIPYPREIRRSLERCTWPWLTDRMRLPHLRRAFFAKESEIPQFWIDGWHFRAAVGQGAAVRATQVDDFWGGGDAPMLVIVGDEDAIAPYEHTAALLLEEFPGRTEALRIAGAGHALLPETPQRIAEAVVKFLVPAKG